MGLVAEKLVGLQLIFPAKASETGKLYGSVTTMMIANDLTEKLGIEITKRNIQGQPLRLLGMHKVKVQLTIDLLPEIDIVIYREGEPIENYMVNAEILFAGAEEEVEEYLEVEEVDQETEEEQPDPEAEQVEEASEDVEVVEEDTEAE